MDRKIVITVVLLALAIVAPAAHARTIHEDVNVAHRYWGPNQCQGKMHFEPDATLRDRAHGGEAHGWQWDGQQYVWNRNACWATYDPSFDEVDRCIIVVHEVGHFIHGPEHVGPMAPGAIQPTECYPPEPRPPTVRQKVRATIREMLPGPSSWEVRCGRTQARMVCRAVRGKRVQHFVIRVVDGEVRGVVMRRR